MPTKTGVSAGSPNAQFVQAAGLFAQSMQRNSNLGRLSGPMPKGESSVNGVVSKQTTTDMPIVKNVDLTRGRGDEVEFHFVQPVGAYPIMGSRMAEGKGTGFSLDKARYRVNQSRFPIDLGDTMTDLRSPVVFERLGRTQAKALMDSYMDQSLLVHMAGARGFHDNIEWRIPVAAHEQFAEMAINPVKAPTKNRHFMAGGTNGIEPISETADELNIQATDLLTMDTLDGVRVWVESVALPPPSVRIEGDMMADDVPLRVMLVSPAQYQSFAQDPAFRQFQSGAMARASKAKDHDLFKGSIGLWNGILLMQMPKPIRFYAGDEIRYCADNLTEIETTCVVPAAFGTTHAVDRAILLGGQAIAQAFGASKHGGMPFFYKTKDFDHDDKAELLVGAIQGCSKIRWLIDQGNGTKHWTDHGITAIDTAVPIFGARQ